MAGRWHSRLNLFLGAQDGVSRPVGSARRAIRLFISDLNYASNQMNRLTEEGLKVNKTIGSLALESGRSAADIGKMQSSIFDLSNATGASIDTTTKLAVALGNVGVGIDDLATNNPYATAGLVDLVHVFGLSADKAAELQVSADQLGTSIGYLGNKAVQFGKEFGVVGLMNQLPAATSFAMTAVGKFSKSIVGNEKDIAINTLKAGAAFSRAFRVDAGTGLKMAQQNFEHFAGAMQETRNVFLGLSTDFPPLVKTLLVTGRSVPNIMDMLSMAKDPDKALDFVQKMQEEVKRIAKYSPITAMQFKEQIKMNIPEHLRAIFESEELLADKQKARAEQQRKTQRDTTNGIGTFDALTESIKGLAGPSMELFDNLWSLSKALIGLFVADDIKKIFGGKDGLVETVRGWNTEIKTALDTLKKDKGFEHLRTQAQSIVKWLILAGKGFGVIAAGVATLAAARVFLFPLRIGLTAISKVASIAAIPFKLLGGALNAAGAGAGILTRGVGFLVNGAGRLISHGGRLVKFIGGALAGSIHGLGTLITKGAGIFTFFGNTGRLALRGIGYAFGQPFVLAGKFMGVLNSTGRYFLVRMGSVSDLLLKLFSFNRALRYEAALRGVFKRLSHDSVHLVGKLTTIFGRFVKLPFQLMGGASGFSGRAAAWVTRGFGGFAKGIGNVTGGLTKFAGGLGTRIGGVVAKLGSGFGAIGSVVGKVNIGSFLGKLAGGAVKAFTSLSILGTVFNQFGKALRSDKNMTGTQKFVAFVKAGFVGLADFLDGILFGIPTMILNAFGVEDGLRGVFAKMSKTIEEWFGTGGGGGFSEKMEEFKVWATKKIEEVTAWLSGPEFQKDIEEWGKNIGTAVGFLAKKATELARESFNAVLAFFNQEEPQSDLSKAIHKLLGVVLTSAWKFIDSVADGFVEELGFKLEDVKGSFTWLWDSIKTSAKSAFDSMQNFIRPFVIGIMKALSFVPGIGGKDSLFSNVLKELEADQAKVTAQTQKLAEAQENANDAVKNGQRRDATRNILLAEQARLEKEAADKGVKTTEELDRVKNQLWKLSHTDKGGSSNFESIAAPLEQAAAEKKAKATSADNTAAIMSSLLNRALEIERQPGAGYDDYAEAARFRNLSKNLEKAQTAYDKAKGVGDPGSIDRAARMLLSRAESAVENLSAKPEPSVTPAGLGKAAANATPPAATPAPPAPTARTAKSGVAQVNSKTTVVIDGEVVGRAFSKTAHDVMGWLGGN